MTDGKNTSRKNPSKNKSQDSYAAAYDKTQKLFEVPYEETMLTTSFGNAHVTVYGEKNAEALVLLHGMNASSTMWYPNAGALAKTFRVYAIDFLLEPGKSTYEKVIDGTEDVVSWYLEIFDRLKLEKPHLVGASRGGWISVSISLKAPGRIKSISLLSPAQTFTWIKPKRDVFANILYALFPKKKKTRRILSTMSSDVDKIKSEFIEQFYLATKEAEQHKCLAEMKPFSKSLLGSLNIPVFVLIGDQDIINKKESLDIAKENIPNVKAETIPFAGHFLSFDQAETVNTKILDFLKTVP